MKPKAPVAQQTSFLLPTLAEQCDPRQPLKQLADTLPWATFETAFAETYSEAGRPAKPVRLMVGLLLLKQLENLSDEAVVTRWVQNPYYQHFCGLTQFQWELPCDPSELVYFRRRIGEQGVALILAVSARLHGEHAAEPTVVVDSTVQEKNVTWPTDTKLYHKIIRRCWQLADAHGVRLRRRYRKEVRARLMAQRWRKDPRKRKAAHKGQRRLRTIAGALIRELERKLPGAVVNDQREHFTLYRRVLRQQRHDTHKVYSLHEPQVYCLAKGKAHQPYEFGSKASVVMTATHGVIVAAVAHAQNEYDGHTLPEVLEWTEAITGQRPQRAIVDRGYRGRPTVGPTEILLPGRPAKDQSPSRTQQLRRWFRRRAAIEPVISHLKHDFRLGRCFLKGSVGDRLNLMLAGAAWNLRKWLRAVLLPLFRLLQMALPLPVR